jgi:hypothetical protein
LISLYEILLMNGQECHEQGKTGDTAVSTHSIRKINVTSRRHKHKVATKVYLLTKVPNYETEIVLHILHVPNAKSTTAGTGHLVINT